MIGAIGSPHFPSEVLLPRAFFFQEGFFQQRSASNSDFSVQLLDESYPGLFLWFNRIDVNGFVVESCVATGKNRLLTSADTR